MEWLLALDRELFLFLNGLGSAAYDEVWLLLTHKVTNVLVYLLLALFFLKARGPKAFLLLLLWVALLILASDQTANLFKYGFQRFRPCHDPSLEGLVRLAKPTCGGLYSYFSAHASNSFALATFFSGLLGLRFKKLPFVLLFIAFLVAYSRIYIGVHYPLDILSGMAFGAIFGQLFFYSWKKILPQFVL